MALWRMTLDVPHVFAVEPGFQRDPHHREFRPEKDSFNNCVLEPATNLLMLMPSYQKRTFTDDFKRLSQFRSKAGWWQDSYRGKDPSATTPGMFSAVKPAESGFPLIEILVDVAIVAIEAAIGLYDDMKWILESNFTLSEDEGFVIHYHSLGDEFRRKRNWYIVMWDNIACHFAYDGRCRVYQYDRDDLTQAPELFEEFVFASPGELLNKSGYFVFLPIPGYGLSITHSRVPQKSIFDPSNVNSGTSKAHLVNWPKRTISGNDRLFEASTVRIGHNPYIPPVLGFQNITYTAGDYTDAIFDPGFKPSVNPSQLDAYALTTGYGTVAATLRKADNSAAWGIGDRQGRVKVALTPDGSGKHTPFVMFWDVAFDPVFATRLTTPLELASYGENGTDRLMAMEWGDDALGRFEGKAQLMLSTTAARAIALRGDATFRVDWRYTTGDSWETLFGGFAKDWKITLRHAVRAGTWLECEVTLVGMEERFRETHRLFESAFDGGSVGSAIQGLLRGCSLPALASVPTEAQNKIIPRPPDGKTWRFAPKEGQSSEEMLQILLLFLHTQGVEWRMPYVWDSQVFVLEERPKYEDGDAWTLVPTDEEANASLHRWAYGERAQMDIQPPEANIIILEGLTDPSSDGKRVYAQARNEASISDTASVDYLGRSKVAKLTFHGIADKGELNIMARRVKDAISHQRATEFVPIRHLQMGIGPNVKVYQYDAEGALLYEGYVIWRGVTLAEDGNEEMTLECDSVWERGIK